MPKLIYVESSSLRVTKSMVTTITPAVPLSSVGQSVYGRVVKFFEHICPKISGLYAYVEWFNKTDYPTGTPLVVRIQDNSQAADSVVCISIFDIDPSRVIVERCDKESCYYMCRIEGLDTVKN